MSDRKSPEKALADSINNVLGLETSSAMGGRVLRDLHRSGFDIQRTSKRAFHVNPAKEDDEEGPGRV